MTEGRLTPKGVEEKNTGRQRPGANEGRKVKFARKKDATRQERKERKEKSIPQRRGEGTRRKTRPRKGEEPKIMVEKKRCEASLR